MEIYIYCIILTGYLALLFLSRGSEGAGLSKIARYLYRRGRKPGQKSKRLSLFKESGVRRDIALLYPFGRTGEEEERFYTERIRLVLMILLSGTILAAAVYIAAGGRLLLTEGNRLAREEIGGEDRSTQVDAYLWTPPQVEGESGEAAYQGSYKLEVRARKYSGEQTAEMAEQVFEELPEMILGGNESLSNVRSSLQLPSELPGMPFRIVWESSSYALVDADGRVGNTAMEEGESRNVTLTAVLTYDDGTAGGLRYERPYEVTVLAPRLEEQERLTSQIRDAIVSGELQENMPLPSIRLLAKDLHISVITTKRAYEDLERDGYIYTVPAKGSFVAEKNICLESSGELENTAFRATTAGFRAKIEHKGGVGRPRIQHRGRRRPRHASARRVGDVAPAPARVPYCICTRSVHPQ